MTRTRTLAADAVGQPAGPGRGSARGMLGPLVALASLGLVLLIVHASGVSLTGLNEIHAEAARTYGVGGVHVEGWVSGEYNPFVDGRLSVLTVMLIPVWTACVAAIGRPLVAAIPGAGDWPSPVMWIAAYLPGYLVVLAPLQLIMSALTLPTGARVGFAAVVVAAIALNRRPLAAFLREPRAHISAPGRSTAWAGAAILGGLIVAAVHRLQAGRNFMVPDSGISLLQWADAQSAGRGPGRYLAHWDQQADEWVFNAPVMFFRSGTQDHLLPIYIAQVFGLVSFAVLIGVLVHAVAPRRRIRAAVAVAAVVLAATPVIDPRYYISLWGGQTPAMWLGHPGREIAIVAPWAILLVLTRGPARRPPAAVVALATLGLAFITVHATAFIAVVIVGVLVWRALSGRAPGLLAHRAGWIAVHACAVACLLAPLAVFAGVIRVDDPDPLAAGLVAGALLALAAAVVLALDSAGAANGAGVRRGAVLTAGWFGLLAVGLLISGNLTSDLGWVQDALGSVLPGYDQPVVSRGLLGANPAGDLRFPVFTGEECVVSAHCTGGAGYLTGFGMMTLVAVAGWFALRGAPVPMRRGLQGAWLVCGALLCLAFVLVDFSGSPSAVAWILTRFVEVPFYGLVALGVTALVSMSSSLTARLTLTLAAIWVLVPFAVSSTPDQWLTNLEYMLGAL